MKRLFTSAAMFLCCMATSFAQFSGSGTGTENDPYLILNPIQLNQLRNFLNKEGVYFKLMADIDLTEFLEDENPSQGWQPVGISSSAAFKGILDGNGKTVSGLWMKRSGNDNVGFFGYTFNSTVKNLKLEGHVEGKEKVGLLAGYGSITIENCLFSGTVSGEQYVGGCAGYAYDGIWQGITSTVRVTGSNNTGGLVGYWDGTAIGTAIITNSYVCTDVVGDDNTGGTCGYSRFVYFTNCGFYGSISGNSYVGGISGKTEGYYDKCFSVGEINGKGNNIGGLLGYSYHGRNYDVCVRNCYFSGSVSGKEQTGGLIGYKEYGVIEYCSSICSVTGTKFVGGLCGMITGSSNGYYAKCKSNTVIATPIRATEDNVGRVYGTKNNTSIGAIGTTEENKAYNRTIVIKAGVAQDVVDGEQNGTGVSATTLKLKATYVAMDWDFNDTWAIQETECYPYFKTQTAPPVITSQVVSGATTISGKCVDGGMVTLEIDGVKEQKMSTGNAFSFTVSPLQAGHEVRISAKANGKEQSYYTTETVAYLGKGTETDPYQVYMASDLTGVYRKGYFKLMNDIDLTSYINQFSPKEGWESIGREGSETIHFDGDGHKITGLWCKSERDNTGLFSCFANGTIKNLTVQTADGKEVKGGSNTAILIGKMINGTIENCKVSGTVADGTPVGGLVGLFTSGSISRCQADVTISTTLATSCVGGLVGEMSSGTLEQCLTNGMLTATGTESYVGGLIGKNFGTVSNCYSMAKVTSSYNAAGLIAYNYGVVENSYTKGDLYSQNYAAGVIGYNDGENAVVRNCVAINNKIEVVYESQQVQQGGGYGQRIIGGIKNGAPAPEMNNYALKTMQVSVNNVPQKVYDDIMNGAAKTESELKAKETYLTLGWDFSEIWGIDDDMPILRNVSVTDDNGQGTPGEGDDTETKKNGEMWGDVNADGVVDVADIATIISIMAEKARGQKTTEK